MMKLANDIRFSKVKFGIKGDNPTQVIKNLSSIISRDTQLSLSEIHDNMDHLFQTSMTGIGDGIAFFDWMSPSISSPYLLCAKLDTPVTLSFVDDKGVDIVLALISPRNSGPLHLQYLARVTRMFREPKLLENLRAVDGADGLSSLLVPENRVFFAA